MSRSVSVQSWPPRLWKVYPARGEQERVSEREIPLYSEWLRLLLGRSLAFAQRGDHGVEYLVLGIGLDELGKERGARARVREALEADFEVLAQSIRKHADIVKVSPGSGAQPIAFIRAYSLLSVLRLPTVDEDWIVTDEGLSITNWGLKSGRPLFEWREEHLLQMKQRLLQLIATKLPDDASAEGLKGRAPSREAAEQAAQIVSVLEDSSSVAGRKRPDPPTVGPKLPATGEPARGPSNGRTCERGVHLPTWAGRTPKQFATFASVAVCLILLIGVFSGLLLPDNLRDRLMRKSPPDMTTRAQVTREVSLKDIQGLRPLDSSAEFVAGTLSEQSVILEREIVKLRSVGKQAEQLVKELDDSGSGSSSDLLREYSIFEANDLVGQQKRLDECLARARESVEKARASLEKLRDPDVADPPSSKEQGPPQSPTLREAIKTLDELLKQLSVGSEAAVDVAASVSSATTSWPRFHADSNAATKLKGVLDGQRTRERESARAKLTDIHQVIPDLVSHLAEVQRKLKAPVPSAALNDARKVLQRLLAPPGKAVSKSESGASSGSGVEDGGSTRAADAKDLNEPKDSKNGGRS